MDPAFTLFLAALEAGVKAGVTTLLDRSRADRELLETVLGATWENTKMNIDTLTIVRKLQVDMAAQTTVVAGFTTFTQTLQATINDLKTSAMAIGADETLVAGLTALDQLVTTNTGTLAALTSNTASSSEPIPSAPVPVGVGTAGSGTSTSASATAGAGEPNPAPASDAQTGGATTANDPPSLTDTTTLAGSTGTSGALAGTMMPGSLTASKDVLQPA